MTTKSIIPSVEELKKLHFVNKEVILKKIVQGMKNSAALGRKTCYINFPSCELNLEIAQEIKEDLVRAGYGVTVFNDTSYRNEGISFTVSWV